MIFAKNGFHTQLSQSRARLGIAASGQKGHSRREGRAAALGSIADKDKAGHTRDLLPRHGISCSTITRAGTGNFEFEAASGVYTELH
jgi:hypothetical protein